MVKTLFEYAIKPLPKTNPRCPYCNGISKKKGLRKNKLRTTQRYQYRNKEMHVVLKQK